MTPIALSNDRVPQGTLIRFPGFEVSWAGEGPTAGQLCFGSEDGRLRWAHIESLAAEVSVLSVESKEAVNGAAFLGRFCAASTRDEVVLITLRTTRSEKDKIAVFPGGAHDIIATAAGQFVAPLGRNGLLVWKPELGDVQNPVICRVMSDKQYYFYRVISLNAAYSEVLVCATRMGGVTVAVVPQPNRDVGFNSFVIPGLDVIDVCALGSATEGLAVGALDRDCTLIFFRDVERDSGPVALKVNGIEGTAYNLLCARGHIFVHTSRGLYVLKSLAKRFLDGEPIDRQPTVVTEIPLEAVDAYLAYDRWLLIVMVDHTLIYDVEQLIGQEANGEAYGKGQEIVPTFLTSEWQHRQETMLVGAA